MPEAAITSSAPIVSSATGTEQEPLLILIQPPPSVLAIPINMVDHAWACSSILIDFPELRIPR
jgi:hypothetical protein